MAVHPQLKELNHILVLCGKVFCEWIKNLCHQIKLLTLKYVLHQIQQTLANAQRKVAKFYNMHSFNIHTMLLDGKFICLQNMINHMNVIMTAKDKQVGDIKRID